VPYYPALIRLLVAAAATRNGVTARGEVYLTEAQANHLRVCEFPTAAAGWWKVPPLAPDLVHVHALPAHLADGWVPPRLTPATLPTPPVATPITSRYGHLPLSIRLRTWLAHRATPEQLRVLTSLLRSPAGVAKRRLQQNLHRVPADRLNHALGGLVAQRLLARGNGSLSLPPDVREALCHAGLGGVSRSDRARAQTDRGASTRTHARRPRLVCYEGRDGRVHWMPARINGRRPLPPRGTRAWGISMRARKAARARHQKCRALGLNPTARATARRLELQRQKRETASTFHRALSR
jgi:hypothetical protein